MGIHKSEKATKPTKAVLTSRKWTVSNRGGSLTAALRENMIKIIGKKNKSTEKEEACKENSTPTSTKTTTTTTSNTNDKINLDTYGDVAALSWLRGPVEEFPLDSIPQEESIESDGDESTASSGDSDDILVPDMTNLDPIILATLSECPLEEFPLESIPESTTGSALPGWTVTWFD